MPHYREQKIVCSCYGKTPVLKPHQYSEINHLTRSEQAEYIVCTFKIKKIWASLKLSGDPLNDTSCYFLRHQPGNSTSSK